MSTPSTQKTKSIAMNGMLTAIAWCMVIIASYLPTGRFFILAITSLCITISWLEWGRIAALTVYLAVAFLTLLWPGLLNSLSFIIFFGLFPLLFLFLREKISRIPALIILHLIMTILLVVSLLIFGIDAFLTDTKGLSGISLWLVIVLVFQLVLLLYAYLMRRLTQLWLDRIKNRD
ncbi:MAG TPA: hypothetical protein GXX72_01065 [Clostridiaceae bacterium]|nr:hypothetical protein [Clostridiaceae bacterium]